MLKSLALSLNPRQAATVAFVSAFVTVIGGFLLAVWFRRCNARKLINERVEKIVDRLPESAY